MAPTYLLAAPGLRELLDCLYMLVNTVLHDLTRYPDAIEPLDVDRLDQALREILETDRRASELMQQELRIPEATPWWRRYWSRRI